MKKALAELTREGFILRRQGRGTFVARPDFGRSFFRFFRFDLNQASDGVVPISKVLFAGASQPPPRVREVLRLSKRERVLQIKRLRAFNDLPLMYEDLYLPEKIFAGLDRIDISRELLYPIYDSRFNTPIIWADEFLEPRLATPEVAGHLGISPGDPVIFLSQSPTALKTNLLNCEPASAGATASATTSSCAEGSSAMSLVDPTGAYDLHVHSNPESSAHRRRPRPRPACRTIRWPAS